MSAVNAVVLSGRLVRDPELRHAASGTAIFNNAIAVESYDPNAEDNRRVSFINFTVFGNFAEQVLTPKLKKGDNITIQGELRQRSWEAEDGSKRSAVEVIARQVVGEFQFRKNGETTAPAADEAAEQAGAPEADAAPAEEASPEAVAADDDIPF